jgi:hypothetical protein
MGTSERIAGQQGTQVAALVASQKCIGATGEDRSFEH